MRRRLSEAERKEKKMIKVETDKKEGTHVAVFKVNTTSSRCLQLHFLWRVPAAAVR